MSRTQSILLSLREKEDNDSDYQEEDEEEEDQNSKKRNGKKQKFQYDYGNYVAPIFTLPGNRVVFDNQSYTGKLLHTYCYKHRVPLTLREGAPGFIAVDREIAISANLFPEAIATTTDTPPPPVDSLRFHLPLPRAPAKIITTAKITP
jgi:hypothetical protein